MSDAAGIKNAAASGVGGIALFGDPGSGLAKRLAAARRSAPQGVTPFIASDEEGGRVQRLAAAIYPLPSAERMGTWTPTKIQSAAEGYGRRMRTLGVTMSFGPVADLAIPGHYIAELGRGFSREPDKVASAVDAWDEGLRRAGVVAVVKHWPGHGEARNTHTGPATVPSLGTLRRRDMLPFNAAFAAHVPAVMVGHLRVPGLTGPTIPATESPAALRYLRVRAGDATLVITDDLAMAAASTAMGITPSTAAVRALQAGADMALNCQPPFARTVEAIRQAIDNGLVPRPQALASVRRILAVKYANGPATK